MGKVAVTLKLMPESPSTNMENIKEKVLKLEAKEIKEEEIAFGLKSLKVLFLMEDKGGVQEEIIKNLELIEGVREVQIIDTTLI